MAKTRLFVTLTLLGALTALPAATTAPAHDLAAPAADPGAWSWPLAGHPELLRLFDPPAQRWSPGHRGLDLGAAGGEALLAPAPGIVSYAAVVVDRRVLVIDHGHGLLSSFEPVAGTPRPGTAVAAGDRVGTIDTGGHCDGHCLHWGLRLHNEYIDPMLTISDRRPSILLPLGG
ncbi:M23 family metallopeptidase [Paeniglutamicibacter cryotolerans]|uniref:Murein DD-endopeptidase MepM/ murein hydrolase activator NlpD n=1 Tax=Paeniglutamicibacter cryotolerans TaxID=670079 RepID=A0A839QQ47_9MICC|nr:M23 family metallopeptidase [Paeniglutamicibacter cryotolerans]MBB2996116.1 murein DD-endopeptidase MepM/ murein hydrolase activator NlpD [Paeniglutamicibacter cryotolerans]